jgi:hypothetical protein
MSHPRFSSLVVPPLEDEDLLEEILLRLPSQPSSLPRASLVRKRWRTILSSPQFFTRFRKRNGKPPLLGFFVGDFGMNPVVFTPVLDPRIFFSDEISEISAVTANSVTPREIIVPVKNFRSI